MGHEPSKALDDGEKSSPITRPGDLWMIGEVHRLLYANSLEASSFTALMDGKRAQVGLTDPPYTFR